jgi:hypothetical protein
MGTAFTSEVLIAFGRNTTSYGTNNASSEFCLGAATSTGGTQEVFAAGQMQDVINSQI